MRTESRQDGMTLIEVMVALLVLSVGVLGVAMLQLSALKHTDSALRSTQVSFIAHDLLERIRANPDAHYAIASLNHAPGSGNLTLARDQDLFDFADQLRRMAGDDAQACVSVTGARVTIEIDWNDSRAQGDGAQRETLTLSSLVMPERGPQP